MRAFTKCLSLVFAMTGLFACGDDPPAQCRSQCELAGSCAPIAFADYPSLAETKTQWNSCANAAFIVVGKCENGDPVMRKGNGYTSELRFFNAAGAFQGLVTTTDVVDETCKGQSYWPEVVRCKNPIVTETVCGGFTVGSPVISDHWGNY